ncbi:CpsD/CapB family tyrosine-protein kinase [Phenylobacterium sp. CCH9-H3]|uniref:CpsD/CapB family tyrosine-protein kinase n=1 Tax=Phenylobacterium sp. CCH9-H3 TaxID=1768774 RepID=UPI00083B6CF0|nr:CpsD/CapB family tyrosine-protein kinase [Phenylobacterium sp. CCH9-H3]
MTATSNALAATSDPLDDRGRAGAAGDERRYRFSSDLVVLASERPREVEAVRTIRTHILARHLEGGRRGLAICSPDKGAGCSFIAANLAVAFAQVGVSTLLVDADMRDPEIERFVQPPEAPVGLKQCIEADVRDTADFVHADVLPNLSVMYSGGRADNAQELLGDERFKRLAEVCLRDYELTIFDSPPAKSFADARRIARVVGYALIVAKRNATLMSQVSTLSAELQEDGCRVVGSVLNELAL